MFSWEALAAISTAVTAIIIAAAVAVGFRQIRVAGDQLEHLRRSTQLDGTMEAFAELGTPEFRASRLFVENEPKRAWRILAFSANWTFRFKGLEQEHKEIIVAQTFEKSERTLDTACLIPF